jgi:hypothetical protein
VSCQIVTSWRNCKPCHTLAMPWLSCQRYEVCSSCSTSLVCGRVAWGGFGCQFWHTAVCVDFRASGHWKVQYARALLGPAAVPLACCESGQGLQSEAGLGWASHWVAMDAYACKMGSTPAALKPYRCLPPVVSSLQGGFLPFGCCTWLHNPSRASCEPCCVSGSSSVCTLLICHLLPVQSCLTMLLLTPWSAGMHATAHAGAPYPIHLGMAWRCMLKLY